jgi:hypothetical protein
VELKNRLYDFEMSRQVARAELRGVPPSRP